MRFFSGLVTIVLFFTAASLHAQTTFALKSAPPDLQVFLNGELVHPISTNGTLRNFRLNAPGMVRFSAPGYQSLQYHTAVLRIRNGILGIKLEVENGILQRLGEYATGRQPKSAYFSPDGRRVFVPLLDEHGVDVFRMSGHFLRRETRLTVPGSTAVGFVEVMFDTSRRELWVSNMVENKVHIFDLDTLAHKTSASTEGIFPKVITQSPDGSITVTSNWVTRDISVFDSDTKKVQRRIPVGGTPRGMAFSPDGSLLYAAIFDEPVIAVVDMNENRVVNRFRFREGVGAARHIIYREGKLYVSDMYWGTLNILDAATGALLRSRRLGPNINTIVLSPDGRYIFASSRGWNNPISYYLPGPDFGAIFMLNAKDLTLIERVWGRNQPTGLDISPNGRFLVFTDFLDANLQLYRLPL